METITLWTRQVPEVYDEIQREGCYYVKKEYIEKKNGSISEYYLNLYDWFTSEAKKYVHLTEREIYPIWFSVSDELMLQPVENMIILKAEIPKEHVLICNYSAWGYCVNYWYVPLNTEDEKAHEKELRRYGLKSDDELFMTNKGLFYPVLRRKVEKSWGRVFSMKPETIEETVAVAWVIKKEWVREVRTYEG